MLGPPPRCSAAHRTAAASASVRMQSPIEVPSTGMQESSVGIASIPVAGGSLTKAALVEQVAHAADLTKQHAAIIVDTLFGSIVEALRDGDKVELRGFGTFRLRRRGPHRGRNPRTGDRVDVPSKRVACFKPGKQLKESVNRDPAQPVPPLSE